MPKVMRIGEFPLLPGLGHFQNPRALILKTPGRVGVMSTPTRFSCEFGFSGRWVGVVGVMSTLSSVFCGFCFFPGVYARADFENA
jgi:hypothetical protein